MSKKHAEWLNTSAAVDRVLTTTRNPVRPITSLRLLLASTVNLSSTKIITKERNMKLFSADLDSLRDLYRNQLRMLLSTEQQITEALPTMIEKATDVQLKQAFQSHLQETRVHVTRLQDILREELREAEPIKCKVLSALVSEAEGMIKDATDLTVRDVALIAAAQRVEHYEIASYGAVRRWAQILGEAEQAALLDQTIQEEGHADHLLTSIADRVNVEADKAA
jgi:ferritin-like metal-binding protein YciE